MNSAQNFSVKEPSPKESVRKHTLGKTQDRKLRPPSNLSNHAKASQNSERKL